MKGKKQYGRSYCIRVEPGWMRTHGWLNSSNPFVALVHRDGDARARQVDSHVADCVVK